MGALLFSRLRRAFEPSTKTVTFDSAATNIIAEAAAHGSIRIIAIEPTERLADQPLHSATAYVGSSESIFLEVTRVSAQSATLDVHGECYYGYRILRVKGPATGQAVANVLLAIRDQTGHVPHIDFAWPEGSHARHLLRFVLFGSGNVAPATREILRRAEPDSSRRPTIHIG